MHDIMMSGISIHPFFHTYNQVIVESGMPYSPRPNINPYGYGFQGPPPWDTGLIADNFASRKRRGGI